MNPRIENFMNHDEIMHGSFHTVYERLYGIPFLEEAEERLESGKLTSAEERATMNAVRILKLNGYKDEVYRKFIEKYYGAENVQRELLRTYLCSCLRACMHPVTRDKTFTFIWKVVELKWDDEDLFEWIPHIDRMLRLFEEHDVLNIGSIGGRRLNFDIANMIKNKSIFDYGDIILAYTGSLHSAE